MGLMLAEPGFHTRAFVEWEEYPRSTIIAGQRAGYLAPAPIWDDLTTFDASPLAGAIDTLLAGYPCQPFSAAGKRLGESDPRHLWPHVARVATELGDGLRWIFLENVAGHITLGAETVLRTLWDMGFTPAAGAFSAAETGAPHERLRWFCVAYRPSEGRAEWGQPKQPASGAQGGNGLVAEPERRGGNGEMAYPTRGGQRVLGDQAQSGSRGYPDGGDGAVADPDGGNPGAEREQPSREQRFQPEGGGTGRGDVVHPGRAERGQSVATGNDADREEEERRQSPDRPEQSGDDVDDPSHGGRGIHAGPGPEGRGTPDAGGARRDMADASQPGPQGREQPGSSDQWDRAPASGPTAERGGLPLFPPGPGDRDAWAVVIQSAPHLAPSASVRDLFSRARSLEADGREWWKATAEPEFCRMVAGLSARTQPLKLLGNAVFPLSAAYAWRTLAAAHGLRPFQIGEDE